MVEDEDDEVPDLVLLEDLNAKLSLVIGSSTKEKLTRMRKTRRRYRAGRAGNRRREGSEDGGRVEDDGPGVEEDEDEEDREDGLGVFGVEVSETTEDDWPCGLPDGLGFETEDD
jgi:hypothetical protein